MPFHQKNGLKYFSFSSFDYYGVMNAIFTRHGGVSQSPWASLNSGGTVGDHPDAVRVNLNRMFQVAGREFSSRYDGWQVHGDYIHRVEDPRPETMPHVKTDGLITNRAEVTLLMRFADCVPVMLYDPVNNVVSVVHAGWKGTVLKIAGKAVLRMMEEYGTKPKNIVAGIGPSIGPEDYEVGSEVIEAVDQAFGFLASNLVIEKSSSIHFDLWHANKLALQQTGVSQIEIAEISTFSHVDDWFSHRKEKGKTGRFGALIAVSEESL